MLNHHFRQTIGVLAGEPSESTEVATPTLKSPALSNKVSRVRKQKYVDENIYDGPGNPSIINFHFCNDISSKDP